MSQTLTSETTSVALGCSYRLPRLTADPHLVPLPGTRRPQTMRLTTSHPRQPFSTMLLEKGRTGRVTPVHRRMRAAISRTSTKKQPYFGRHGPVSRCSASPPTATTERTEEEPEDEDASTSSLPREADVEMKTPMMARKSTGPRRWVADADGRAGNNIRSGRVVKERPPVRQDTGVKTLPGRGRRQPPVEKKKEKRFRPGQLR